MVENEPTSEEAYYVSGTNPDTGEKVLLEKVSPSEDLAQRIKFWSKKPNS